MELTALMRLVVQSRLLPVSPSPALIPWLIPCNRPNSKKRDDDRQHGQDGARLLAPQSRPDEHEILHAALRAGESTRRPLSTCSVREA